MTAVTRTVPGDAGLNPAGNIAKAPTLPSPTRGRRAGRGARIAFQLPARRVHHYNRTRRGFVHRKKLVSGEERMKDEKRRRPL